MGHSVFCLFLFPSGMFVIATVFFALRSSKQRFFPEGAKLAPEI